MALPPSYVPVPPLPAVKKPKAGWRPQPINSGVPGIDNQDAAIQLIYDLGTSNLKQGASVQKGAFHKATEGVRNAYGSGMDMLKDAAAELAKFSGSFTEDLHQEAARATMGDLQKELARGMSGMAKRRTIDLNQLVNTGAAYYNAAREEVTGNIKEKEQARVDARTTLQKLLAEMQIEREKAQAEVELARINAQTAKMEAAARARSSGGGGGSVDPLDELRAAIMGEDFRKKQAANAFFEEHGYYPESGPPSSSGGVKQTGYEGFINSAQPGYWEDRAGPKFRAAVDRLIGQSATFKQDGVTGRQFGQRSIFKDPYYTPFNKQALLTALRLRL